MKHQIKEAKYEGYLWASNQTAPKILSQDKKESFTLTDGENPFIVEGLLWNQQKGKSISIRYVDGKYYIAEYNVKTEELAGTPTMTPISYLPHRLSGIKALKFLRKWEEENDELCENMPVLQLQANIFIGFEK